MSGHLDALLAEIGAPLGGRSGNGTALLHEIATLLGVFARSGESGSIDLRAVPLSSGDYQELRDALGQGAVVAVVTANGESKIHETLYPGVWWVTHYNEDGGTLADLIEICSVPSILVAPKEDVADGVARLSMALAAPTGKGRAKP